MPAQYELPESELTVENFLALGDKMEHDIQVRPSDDSVSVTECASDSGSLISPHLSLPSIWQPVNSGISGHPTWQHMSSSRVAATATAAEHSTGRGTIPTSPPHLPVEGVYLVHSLFLEAMLWPLLPFCHCLALPSFVVLKQSIAIP